MVKDIPKIIIGSVPGHLKTLRPANGSSQCFWAMRTKSGGGGQITTKGTLAKQDYLMASLKCYLPYGFQVMTLLLFLKYCFNVCG